jgi:hypothetical protein
MNLRKKTVIFAYAMVNLGILKITFNCFLTYKAIQTRPPVLLTEWYKCIAFLDNLHCTSKQCVLPHMPTVIPLFTCVNIDCTSKMGGTNCSTFTLFR